MELSNVSSIIIPEGSVSKITDSQGRVLWRALIPLTEAEELLCVKSTNGGGQYIDTGAKPFLYTKWKIELDFMPTRLYNYNMIYCISSNDTDWECWITSGGTMYVRHCGVRKSVMTVAANTRYKMVIEYTGGKLTVTVNDAVKINAASITHTSNAATFVLFKRATIYGEFKVYGCKIWTSGNLIRDYTPMMYIDDGYAALYDSVSETRYRASGNDFEYEELSEQ